MSPLLAGLFERLADMAESGLRDAYLTVLASRAATGAGGGFMLSAALDVRLLRVLERVCRHPSIEYGLAELAVDSGASVRTLNRLFSQQLGCSFRQWRQQVVMGRARQLQQQGQPLSRIALELGYGDFSAFLTLSIASCGNRRGREAGAGSRSVGSPPADRSAHRCGSGVRPER